MVEAATLMMPDGGSTLPGATASHRRSACGAGAAVAEEAPLRNGPFATTAAPAATRIRPAARAILRFDMLIYVLAGDSTGVSTIAESLGAAPPDSSRTIIPSSMWTMRPAYGIRRG